MESFRTAFDVLVLLAAFFALAAARRNLSLAALSLAAALEIVTTGSRALRTADPSGFPREPELAAAISAAFPEKRLDPPVVLSRGVKNPRGERNLDYSLPSQAWAVARQNLAMLYGFATADGYNSTEPVRLYLARRALAFSNLLRLQNVEATVNRSSLPVPDGWNCGGVVVAAEARVCRMAGPAALGAIRAPRRWEVVSGQGGLGDRLAARNWDPAEVEYLGSLADGPDYLGIPDGESGPVTVETLGYRPAWRHYRVSRTTPGPVIFRDNYDPDWKLLINGEPVPALAANGFQLAGWTPAGTSEVELRYEPLSLDLGLLISAATAAGLLLWMRRPERADEFPAEGATPNHL